ncbi:MAG: hydrogenase maturation protease [Ignavibacteria bacterium]|nr:hydrogenase maturation protease [Ignavibacteria bacterium]
MNALIMGMGNTLLSDDGIGIIIKRYLEQKMNSFNKIKFEETHWGGFRVIDLLRGFDYAIVIDSIKTGRVPEGEIHHLKTDDLLPTLRLNSYHDINFITALHLAKKMDYKIPSDIDILAIEIENNYTITENLNSVIRNSVITVSKKVIELLKSKGFITDERINFENEFISEEELKDYYLPEAETENK